MKRILIIDNDPLTCHDLKTVLEKRGFQIKISTNGDELFDKQQKLPVPDLVITEIMQLRPKMDTYGLVRALKSSPQTQRTKVMICSGKRTDGDVERATTAGADELVSKPFDPPLLADRISELLGLAGPGQATVSGEGKSAPKGWVDFRRKVSQVPEDQRRHPRLEFHCPVRIEGVTGVHKITDISLGGVFVEYDKPSSFQVGQLLHLVIKIPTEYEPIKVKAQVANLRKRGIGFRYVDLSAKNQQIIHFCFDTFKDTIPLR